MRSVLNCVRRAIDDTKIETVLESDSLNLHNAERLVIIEALTRVQGNRTLAAQLLGIARSTLFEKMKCHDIVDKKSKVMQKVRDWKIEGLNV